jgi:acetyl esterase/lipase
VRTQDYPEQDPVSPQAVGYRDACMSGSFGVPFAEFSFGPDPHQSIAIYPAEQPTGVAFAFIHGGGWTGGYKETMGFMAPAFTRHGILFASIGYRLAPEFLFPDGLEDCAAGLAAFCKHMGAFGGDPKRLCIGGHSAGGHYAALLAVRNDWQVTFGLPADIIKACLPISGVFRFGPGSGLSARPRFLGPENNGADEAASPVLHVRRKAPPFFMACGEKDFPHLIDQATEMENVLARAGTEVTSIVMPGLTHFTASLAGGTSDGPWVPRALDFIERTCGSADTPSFRGTS